MVRKSEINETRRSNPVGEVHDKSSLRSCGAQFCDFFFERSGPQRYAFLGVGATGLMASIPAALPGKARQPIHDEDKILRPHALFHQPVSLIL
jgi:hypothetical protein